MPIFLVKYQNFPECPHNRCTSVTQSVRISVLSVIVDQRRQSMLRMVAMFFQYAVRLNRSFVAAYELLESPKLAGRTIFALLMVHTGLLAYSAYVHSPTLDEPGHLVAGLSIWEFGRFDVYSVNPPLVKMVAALPVIAVGYKEDWSGLRTGPGARPEFRMGEDFLAANGERSFLLFMIARWACIPFSWVGGIVCYLWARDFSGRAAGVVACTIWCFEPNILAHASLITPDAHATSLGVAACYTFWRWLKRPTWSQAVLTGVILGLAELTKTTLILFYPLWPVMWLLYRWPDRRKLTGRDWGREAGMLAVRMAIGLYVVNLGYAFEGTLQPLGEFPFVSAMLTGQPAEIDQAENDGFVSGVGHQIVRHQAADSPTSQVAAAPMAFRFENGAPYNRFADSWGRYLPTPLPRQYLLGIDLQQKDFEKHGKTSFLRGEWRDHGWWYYYLYAVAIKVPMGLWGLGVLSLLVGLFATRKRRARPFTPKTGCECRHTVSFVALLILILPPLVIFIVVSSKTGINEHMRYILPCFPFVFIAISKFSGNLLDIARRYDIECAGSESRLLSLTTLPLVFVLLLWSVVSSCWIYPHSLCYFNESVGGPLSGRQHLRGSNLDWGQDLLYLKAWRSKRYAGALTALAHSSSPNWGNLRGWGFVPMAESPLAHCYVLTINARGNSLRRESQEAIAGSVPSSGSTANSESESDLQWSALLYTHRMAQSHMH